MLKNVQTRDIIELLDMLIRLSPTYKKSNVPKMLPSKDWKDKSPFNLLPKEVVKCYDNIWPHGPAKIKKLFTLTIFKSKAGRQRTREEDFLKCLMLNPYKGSQNDLKLLYTVNAVKDALDKYHKDGIEKYLMEAYEDFSKVL